VVKTASMLEAQCRKRLRGSVGTGAKEDELGTGRDWAAGFHVTARSRVVRALKSMNCLFL
jgi:hypothetical protein